MTSLLGELTQACTKLTGVKYLHRKFGVDEVVLCWGLVEQASQISIIERNYGNYHSIILVRTAYLYIRISESNYFSLHDILNSDGSENITRNRFIFSLLNTVQPSNCQCISSKTTR